MKFLRLLTACILAGSLTSAAEPTRLFFERSTRNDLTRIALTIDDGQVTGSQTWQPDEGHGSSGTLDGILGEDGLIQVVYIYTIEGSEQSEEQVFMLKGGALLAGEGELEDAGNGRMNLKEPNKVAFTKEFKPVKVRSPVAGTAERKAIMEAMRGPVSEEIGKPVIFTGSVLASGSWATFQGNVKTTDGTTPKNEEAAALLDLDFFALLKKDGEGNWQILDSGFAGDTGVRDQARENHEDAPWVLFE